MAPEIEMSVRDHADIYMLLYKYDTDKTDVHIKTNRRRFCVILNMQIEDKETQSI